MQSTLNRQVIDITTADDDEVMLLPSVLLSDASCEALNAIQVLDDITSQRARREVLSKITFSTTGSHRCQIEGVLILNLQAFCSEICQGVESWNEDYKESSEVQGAIKELLTIYTQGFSPSFGIFIE